jgi:hypothetical protein
MQKIVKYVLGIAFAIAAIFVFPVVSDAATVSTLNGASIMKLGTNAEDAKQGMRFLIRVNDVNEGDDYGIDLSYKNPTTNSLVEAEISVSKGYDKVYAQGEGWKEYTVVITGITEEYFTTSFTAKGFVKPQGSSNKIYDTKLPDGVSRSIYEVSEKAGYTLAENGTLLQQEVIDLSTFVTNASGNASYDAETGILSFEGTGNENYLTFPLSKQLALGDSIQVAVDGVSTNVLRTYLGTNGTGVGGNQSESVVASNLPGVWKMTSKVTEIGNIAIKGNNNLLAGVKISNITVTYLGQASEGNVIYVPPYKIPVAESDNEFYFDLGGPLSNAGGGSTLMTSTVSKDGSKVSYQMTSSTNSKIVFPCSEELKAKILTVENGSKITCYVKGTSSQTATFRSNLVSADGSNWNRFGHVTGLKLTTDSTADPTTYSFSGSVANAGSTGTTADYFMIHVNAAPYDVLLELDYIKIVVSE